MTVTSESFFLLRRGNAYNQFSSRAAWENSLKLYYDFSQRTNVKRAISLITSALVIALLAVTVLPPASVEAAIATKTVKVGSLSTKKGSTTGALSQMKKKDQSGTADNPAKYVLFATPGTVYNGTRVYTLPSSISRENVENLRLRVNVKAPAYGSQKWIWSAYNWNTKKWVRIGDTASASANTWSLLTFQFPASVSRFINSSGQVRIQFRSSNAGGNAKIDSEFVIVTHDSSLCGESSNAAFESEVLSLINQERTSRGIPALTRDSRLNKAARLHSADMACNNFFSHTNLQGVPFYTRITNQGYSYSFAAENIAAVYATPASVVQGWMGSSGHRTNMLNSIYKHIGIGYVYRGGSQWGHYWTTDFASP
jgi:uncharacterized protein YkwD